VETRETRAIIREKTRWEPGCADEGTRNGSPRRILGCTRNAIIPSPSGFGFMNINARLICIMSSYCSGIETSERDRIIPARVSARFGKWRYSVQNYLPVIDYNPMHSSIY